MKYNKIKKTIRAVLILYLILLPRSLYALSIGTFNVEYFSLSGKGAYSDQECRLLADTIEGSGADVLALQEIKDNGTMRYFVTKYLPGFAYSGNDTGGRQDLYFIWNKETIKLIEGPIPYGTYGSFQFQGKSYRLNDRPPLAAVFLHKDTDFRFAVINVHLKSQSTRGKDDKRQAELYNAAKRQAQFENLKKLAGAIKGPLFVLGDFNSEDAPLKSPIPLLGLEDGYSYDNKKVNLDFIGYQGIEKTEDWTVREVEASIPSRSTKNSQHPDHDVIILDL